DRSVVEHASVFHQLVKGLLRKTGDCGKRLPLQLSSEKHRRPFLLLISLRHGRRKDGRDVPDWTEFGCRRSEHAHATTLYGETEMFCYSRIGRNRAGQILAGLG